MLGNSPDLACLPAQEHLVLLHSGSLLLSGRCWRCLQGNHALSVHSSYLRPCGELPEALALRFAAVEGSGVSRAVSPLPLATHERTADPVASQLQQQESEEIAEVEEQLQHSL